jgi:hypothetical protein
MADRKSSTMERMVGALASSSSSSRSGRTVSIGTSDYSSSSMPTTNDFTHVVRTPLLNCSLHCATTRPYSWHSTRDRFGTDVAINWSSQSSSSSSLSIVHPTQFCSPCAARRTCWHGPSSVSPSPSCQRILIVARVVLFVLHDASVLAAAFENGRARRHVGNKVHDPRRRGICRTNGSVLSVWMDRCVGAGTLLLEDAITIDGECHSFRVSTARPRRRPAGL